jgi:hypothetical protein
MSRVARVILMFAVVLGSVLGSTSVAAAEAPFCTPGQDAQFVLGFAVLKSRIGDRMGSPLECEHPGDGGDTVQLTSTGLAFYRQSTNTATFTDGWSHFAHVPGGLIVWTGGEIDPPATRGNAPDGPGLACYAVGVRLCLSIEMDAIPTIESLLATQSGAPLLRTAASTGVRIRYGQTSPRTWAEFSSFGRRVLLSRRIVDFSPADQAPVLAHELQHAADYAAVGRALATTEGCYTTEKKAFETQVAVYRELNPGGMLSGGNALQRELRAVAQAMMEDPVRFADRLVTLYREECDAR